MSSSKIIVITGGTGGIGYQIALALTQLKDEKRTIVVTGRSKESGEKAVASLKEESGTNGFNTIDYAVADLSVQSDVIKLAKELQSRYPQGISDLINNAGNLSTGAKETTTDGIDKNIAVNVIAPYILTKALLPTLKLAKGRVQITSGGSPFDTLNPNDLNGDSMTVGLNSYSHSKRVMESMAIALAREVESEGIVVNVVGGAAVAGTSMTTAMGFWDVPWFMKLMYPLLKLFVFSPNDNGASAKKAAAPNIAAAKATDAELGGTGQIFLAGFPAGKFKPEVAHPDNVKKVLEFVKQKIAVAL